MSHDRAMAALKQPQSSSSQALNNHGTQNLPLAKEFQEQDLDDLMSTGNSSKEFFDPTLQAESLEEHTGPRFLEDPSAGFNDYNQERRRAEYHTSALGLKDIYFEFNSWRLTPEAKSHLVSNAEWLKDHPGDHVTIEGHCDERGTRAYNFALGEKRAMMAKNYLMSLGVKSERIVITSYGKDKPQCQQYTESCFQTNRRAHLVIGLEVVSAKEYSEKGSPFPMP